VSLPNEVALVLISEQPALIEGSLSTADLAAVMASIIENLSPLLAHRNGGCDSAELVSRLRRSQFGQ
jgi:hypothetical protein